MTRVRRAVAQAGPAYNQHQYPGMSGYQGGLAPSGRPGSAMVAGVPPRMHAEVHTPSMYIVPPGAVLPRVDAGLPIRPVPDLPPAALAAVPAMAVQPVQPAPDRAAQPQPVLLRGVLPGQDVIFQPAPSGASATIKKRSPHAVQDSSPQTGPARNRSGESNSPAEEIPTDGSHVGVSGTAESKAPSPGVQSASPGAQALAAAAGGPRNALQQVERGPPAPAGCPLEGPGDAAQAPQAVPAWPFGSAQGSDTSDDIVSWRYVPGLPRARTRPAPAGGGGHGRVLHCARVVRTFEASSLPCPRGLCTFEGLRELSCARGHLYI